MGTVRLAGRAVNRIGISLAGLKVTGMWGEPADRAAAVEVIRRALQLGAGPIEVPVPFGPFADLARQAATDGAFLIARLTGPVGYEMVRRRLGRAPDLVLTPESERTAHDWPVPAGVITDTVPETPPDTPPDTPPAAVRGPYPPPPDLLEWCRGHHIPYLASTVEILEAGPHTIALPAPTSVTEVERLLAPSAPIPPAGGPE